MIRVLHIVPNMNIGGLETFIMNVYRNIDRTKIQFDFLEHYQEDSAYDQEIRDLGGKIYHFSLRNDNNIFKYIINLNNFFKSHSEYKILHCHMESIGALVFIIAKLHGVRVRIGHSHTTATNKNFKGFIKKITSKLFKYTTTLNLACSDEAGNYLFGNKSYNIVCNAIKVEDFYYDINVRKELRSIFNIEEKFVIGHVGRMDQGKNQLFLIDVFYEYLKVNSNACLVLIGDGEDRCKIIKKIREYDIDDKVLLLGTRRDVNKIYSMFDVFVFPSVFEGLGITLIEAQINGLPCIASKGIPQECVISDRVSFLDLSDSIDVWVKKIVDYKDYDRQLVVYNEKKDKYNIVFLVKYLEDLYTNLYK